MSKKVNLVMPMGGSGSRFSKDGFELPKPLLDLDGKPFFYWATQSISKYVELESLTFVVLQEHIDKYKIDEKIKQYYPQASIVIIPHVLEGAVLTCKAGTEAIHNDSPIIFNDCDHGFLCSSFYDYCRNADFTTLDGALLTFESNDPKFSFVELDEQQNVIRTVEKRAISNEAICGAYYFKDVNTFLDATESYLENCDYAEFFVSGLYNEMAKKGLKIRTFKVDMHVAFGTPEEYEVANREKKYLELN